MKTSPFIRGTIPNPARGAAMLQFGLATPGDVALEVFDVAGRHVRTVAREKLRAGIYSRSWDGRDDIGAEVAAGIYLIKLRAGSELRTRKVVFVR